MRNRSVVVALVLAALLIGAGGPHAQDNDSGEAERLQNATLAFDEIMEAEDSAIPESILDNVAGIAIFPGAIRVGFIFGGLRGRGVISARTDGGWSLPAFLTLTGGSFGLQIGGQASDIVLVIMNRRGLETLVSNQFTLGTDASVAAGPVGRDARAATDIQFRAEILSYSRARGLFAGVALSGNTIRQDIDANERFFGSRLTTSEIVFDGLAQSSSPDVREWIDVLNRNSPTQ